jgi:hypothetical protein
VGCLTAEQLSRLTEPAVASHDGLSRVAQFGHKGIEVAQQRFTEVALMPRVLIGRMFLLRNLLNRLRAVR